MKEKKQKEKGIFETVREVNKQEQLEHEKELSEQKKQDEKQREEYEQVLAEEKVELLKLKQGVISDSEKLDLSPDKEKKYTFWQKVKNFFYHNKWWMGIAAFLVLVVGFLVYDSVTSTPVDLNIMFLSDNPDLFTNYQGITDFMTDCIDDYNEDGKKYANLMYIPISEDYDSQVGFGGAYDTNISKLSMEFQMGETMILFADSKTDDVIMPEETLENLEELYPDCPYIKGCKLYLKGTKFAELIGMEGDVPDDLYIGVRKVTKTISPEENTKEHNRLAHDSLKKVIKAIS